MFVSEKNKDTPFCIGSTGFFRDVIRLRLTPTVIRLQGILDYPSTPRVFLNPVRSTHTFEQLIFSCTFQKPGDTRTVSKGRRKSFNIKKRQQNKKQNKTGNTLVKFDRIKAPVGAHYNGYLIHIDIILTFESKEVSLKLTFFSLSFVLFMSQPVR